jgi:hypothetical protein
MKSSAERSFMKKILAYLLLLGTAAHVSAQLPAYAAAPIPEAITKNASQVTRYENISFEVKGISRAVYNVHRVITALNSDAEDVLQLAISTDKFRHLEDADIKLYDANGKLIDKYKKKDLRTISMGDGLVDDGQTHYFATPTPKYPVTIEYKYELSFDGTLHYPSYLVQVPGEAVMQSDFTVKVPKELDIRYQLKNVAVKPVVSDQGSDKLYHWSVKNLSPIEYESGSISDAYPRIILAPNKFKLDDYEGDMSTWKNFGIWYNNVVKGTDKLPEDRKAFYRNLVKDAGSDIEKTRIVYDYLQKNFRYVSIQLGIGGHKPLPADFTDSKKYGDCKGLSNYMRTVLKELGIKSYLAIINRDDKDVPVEADFPIDQFNHVFLCVPLKPDTLWFECTSKTLPFATLDISTQNRRAVLVTEEGGILVSTPKSSPDQNLINIRTTVLLSENGSGSCASDIRATGEYRTELSHFLYDEKKDDQKQYLVRRMGFKQPDDFSIVKKQSSPDFASSVNLQIEKIPEFTAGSKMFLAPFVYKFWSYSLPKADNRKHDFYFDCPFRRTDTTIYKLPEGYVTETIPSAKEISCEYAKYSSRYWYDEKEKAVYSTTTLVLNEQKIPVAGYAGVKTFFDNVMKETGQRIVIKKM